MILLLLLKIVFCQNQTNDDYKIVLFDYGQIIVSKDVRATRSVADGISAQKLKANFQAIVNTTEWELNLEFHDFDEPWMRFAKAMGFRADLIRGILFSDKYTGILDNFS